jgi:XTP/dITP diphosphohydrolase
MGKLVFATNNGGKMREIRSIMEDLGMEILSQKEAGIQPQVEENGGTFEENALIKARAAADLLPGVLVLADDSGLEIDYLNKEPGIYSARYAGEDTSYTIKNQMLLDRLAGVPRKQRTARFVCAIAAVFPSGEEVVLRETMEGFIGDAPAGENGFGYDPIFQVPEYGCSSAELSMEQKNALSHRGRALRNMKAEIKKRFQAT